MTDHKLPNDVAQRTGPALDAPLIEESFDLNPETLYAAYLKVNDFEGEVRGRINRYISDSRLFHALISLDAFTIFTLVVWGFFWLLSNALGSLGFVLLVLIVLAVLKGIESIIAILHRFFGAMFAAFRELPYASDKSSQVGLASVIFFEISSVVIRRKFHVPPASDVNFDDLEVIAPIVRYLSKPVLGEARRALNSVTENVNEASGSASRHASAIQELKAARSQTADPHWVQVFGQKIDALDAPYKKWQKAKSDLESQEGALRKRISSIESEVGRLERYRRLVGEADELLRARQEGGAKINLSGIEARINDARETVRRADFATSTYMAARAELDSELADPELD